jgi:integrase
MATKLATELATETPGKIIGELPVGTFKTLVKIKPVGALQCRKNASGATLLYWRYSANGLSERVLVGTYDSSAPPKSLTPTARGFSIQAAIRAAEALATSHHANLEAGGHRAIVEAKREAQRAAAAEKDDAAKHTLQSLMDAYLAHQKSIGRTSFADAASIFRHHITDAWPKLAALPASEVTPEQVADAMRRLIELGKGRTANKLRTYLSAAYSMAKAAKSKPSIPVSFKAFNIRLNPAADTAPDDNSNVADKNPLSAEELRAYWQIIKPMTGLVGAALRLHLLTGGQRVAQLVRLKTTDVSGDRITLFDGKGRPGKPPRPHTVPLIPLAAAALLELKPQGEYAISTNKGKTHLAPTTLSDWAVEVAVATIPTFAAKRIRSGVETLLASARISSEIRGRLQSHGISGVQARHYDAYEYLDEKRHALVTLFNLLETPEAGNVVQFRAA